MLSIQIWHIFLNNCTIFSDFIPLIYYFNQLEISRLETGYKSSKTLLKTYIDIEINIETLKI